jgi:hypothetical protein
LELWLWECLGVGLEVAPAPALAVPLVGPSPAVVVRLLGSLELPAIPSLGGLGIPPLVVESPPLAIAGVPKGLRRDSSSWENRERGVGVGTGVEEDLGLLLLWLGK